MNDTTQEYPGLRQGIGNVIDRYHFGEGINIAALEHELERAVIAWLASRPVPRVTGEVIAEMFTRLGRRSLCVTYADYLNAALAAQQPEPCGFGDAEIECIFEKDHDGLHQFRPRGAAQSAVVNTPPRPDGPTCPTCDDDRFIQVVPYGIMSKRVPCPVCNTPPPQEDPTCPVPDAEARTGSTMWICPVCNHVMTEEQSQNYRGCPTGMHVAAHVRCPPGMNHYCRGESGAGEWSHRSETVPSICHYCEEPNAAQLAAATRKDAGGPSGTTFRDQALAIITEQSFRCGFRYGAKDDHEYDREQQAWQNWNKSQPSPGPEAGSPSGVRLDPVELARECVASDDQNRNRPYFSRGIRDGIAWLCERINKSGGAGREARVSESAPRTPEGGSNPSPFTNIAGGGDSPEPLRDARVEEIIDELGEILGEDIPRSYRRLVADRIRELEREIKWLEDAVVQRGIDFENELRRLRK